MVRGAWSVSVVLSDRWTSDLRNSGKVQNARMPFPRLFRFLCILLVGCLFLPPLEAASRRSKRSGSAKAKKSKKSKLSKRKQSKGKRYGKGKRGKSSRYTKSKRGKSSRYTKGKRGKAGRYAKGKRGKGRLYRTDYSARPSKPQRKSAELPMTYAEWEKQQRKRR